MNHLYRRTKKKKEEKKAIYEIRVNKLKTRLTYNPPRSDFKKAYALFCQDFSEEKIAKQLGITENCWKFYRPRFYQYFKIQGDKPKQIIPIKRDKNGGNRGSHRKGQYKIHPNTIDLNLVNELSLAGFTQKRICAILGLCEATFIKYKKENPDIQDAIDNAKARADVEVLLALHSVATGYSHKDTHFASYQGNIFSKEYVKNYPPNVQAAINWLLNSPNINWNSVKDANIGTEKGEILEFLDNMHSLEGEE